jgi:hypothetical protein
MEVSGQLHVPAALPPGKEIVVLAFQKGLCSMELFPYLLSDAYTGETALALTDVLT